MFDWDGTDLDLDAFLSNVMQEVTEFEQDGKGVVCTPLASATPTLPPAAAPLPASHAVGAPLLSSPAGAAASVAHSRIMSAAPSASTPQSTGGAGVAATPMLVMPPIAPVPKIGPVPAMVFPPQAARAPAPASQLLNSNLALLGMVVSSQAEAASSQ